MKTNELRINNLISHTNQNGTFILPVIGIEKTHITVQYKEGVWMLLPEEKCDPIPITDEILLKSGFEEIEGSEFWLHKKTRFELSIHEGYYKMSVNSNEYAIGIEIKYIYQLQNVFFFSEGEELEINL